MSILDGPSKLVKEVGDFISNPFKKKTKNEYKGPDFPDGFLIKELTGPKEEVRLVGNMMPKIPFSYGGSQRMSKVFYPGNSEPTIHVLGSEESDTTIKGRLYDKRYSDEKFRGVALEISQQLDAMRIRGNPIRFRMGEWQRYGFIAKTEWDMTTIADIDYSITLELIGFNAPKDSRFLESQNSVPFEINKSLIAAAAALEKARNSMPADMPASLADLLDGLISDVAGVLNTVTSFVDNTLGAVEDVSRSVNRAIGLVRYARAKFQNYKRRLGAISINTQLRALPVPARYSSARYVSRRVSEVGSFQAMLAEMQKRFKDLAKTVPMARHRVVTGETLQKIAVKFYGKADDWKKIYDHNKLSSTDLSTVKVLEIPRL